MDSKERFEAAINNEKPDQVPLGYIFFGAGNAVLQELGKRFKDVYYSGSGIAKAQLKALEMFGHDNVMSPWGCLTVEAEAFGCETYVKENDYPKIRGNLLREREDLENLSVPNPEKDGRMPIVLESIEILSKEIGNSTPVLGLICSPTIVATTIRGYENFTIDMFRDPSFAHEILKITTQCCIDFAEAMIDAGVFGIMLENSCAGEDMMGPEQCEEFVMAYNKKLIGEVKKRDTYVFTYNSSDSPYIDQEIKSGTDVFSFYRGSNGQIKEKHGWDCDKFHTKIGACVKRFCISDFPDDICLMGNVDPRETMLHGRYADAYAEALNCLKSNADRKGGFILSTGCEVPFEAPVENMRALRDAVRNSHLF